MDGACPDFSATDSLVRSLLGVVECHVETIVQSGYASLFQAGGALGPLLTAGLTVYVALIGYQLLLGRSQLGISDFALSAVKIGAVVALATQWGAYQRLIYEVLFHGPEQLAALLDAPWRSASRDGDVFDGLQRAFTDLTAFSPATPPGAPAANAAGGLTAAGAGQLSTLLSKAGFDSLLLLASAVVLLVSTLGVLLAAKIVLGFLLALGPLFIGFMLFEPTFGLFAGWLRAAVAFALAPLFVILALGLCLTLLEPSLQQIEAMRSTSTYLPGVAFGVAVLVLVLAAVVAGLLVAGSMMALGLLQGRSRLAHASETRLPETAIAARPTLAPSRAVRTASAVLARARSGEAASSRALDVSALSRSTAERRELAVQVAAPAERIARWSRVEARLGQQPRRAWVPHAPRSGSRSSRGSDA